MLFNAKSVRVIIWLIFFEEILYFVHHLHCFSARLYVSFTCLFCKISTYTMLYFLVFIFSPFCPLLFLPGWSWAVRDCPLLRQPLVPRHWYRWNWDLRLGQTYVTSLIRYNHTFLNNGFYFALWPPTFFVSSLLLWTRWLGDAIEDISGHSDSLSFGCAWERLSNLSEGNTL